MKYGVTGFDDIIPTGTIQIDDVPQQVKPLPKTEPPIYTMQELPTNAAPAAGSKKLLLYIGIVAALVLVIVFTNKKK